MAENGHVTDLQMWILGTILREPKRVGQVVAALEPEDFTDAMRPVFETVRKLHFEGRPIDPVTVAHELGEEYADPIKQLAAEYRTDNVLRYCEMLRESRRVEEIRGVLMDMQYNRSTLEEMRDGVDQLNSLLSSRRRMRTVSAQDMATSFVERTQKQQKKEFIDWGFDFLNDIICAEPGDFVVIGGYPSAGKTALAVQMALTIAKRYRVGFFSLETSESKITDRIMANLSKVPLKSIKTQSLSETNWRALINAAKYLYQLPIDTIEASSAGVADIQAAALNKRYQVIFVDYLQLIRQKGGTRYDKVTEISMGLHTLAQTHKIVVVALAQLNRPEKSGEDRKPVPPSMSSFKESGQIEQDADVALLLYQEDPNNYKSRRVLKIGKYKEGEKGQTFLDFDGATQTFTEAWREEPSKPRRSGKKKPGYENETIELPD